MPAYSFKERFVPFVKDGSKPHTIRARRRRQSIKKGDTLYLYFGMRTKHCIKLREEICTDVRTIFIGYLFGKPEVGIFKTRLSNIEIEELQTGRLDLNKHQGFSMLSNVEKDRLAWRDGFRPDGTDEYNCEGSFDLKIRFWSETHDLPFYGDIIYWNPKSTKAKNYDFNCRTNLQTSHF
jgi:hypothetical protein